MTKHVGRQHLMEQAIASFRAKGYSATSIDEIVKACGITKGSLYYHFRSKEELALAAMEQVHAYFNVHVFGLITGADHPGISELDAFNKAVEAFFVTHPDGCLLANLSLEIGAAHILFSKRIRSFFSDWRACYAQVFRGFYSRSHADTLAENAVAFVHGCILMYRIDGDIDLLRRQHRHLLALLDHPLGI